MSSFVKGLVTVLGATALGSGAAAFVNLAAGQTVEAAVALLAGAAFGLLYGIEAGAVNGYAIDEARGWIQLVIDFTWSLPNTIFGFVFGNLLYICFGAPSYDLSNDRGWIAFQPRGSSAFGSKVLQTLGTVNLGGKGQHELMHVLQARIFGPLYLPLFGVNYAVNLAAQVLWTATLGLILWAVKVRTKPWLEPPEKSAVSGFLGWIYYFTLFEIWAYATGNP